MQNNLKSVKHSIKAMNELRAAQLQEDLPQHQLLQAMAVRWNSTLIMLERLLEQRTAIDRMAFEKRDFDKITLSIREWNLLEPLKQLLKPVEELSLLLCKSRISVQIPYAKAIVSTLCRLDLRVDTENGPREIIEIETMREKLIEEIKSRFFTLQDDKIHSISMFIDPRFKAEFADDKQIFILRVKSWLNEQKNADDLDDNIVVDDFCEPVTDSPPTKRTLLDAVTDLVKNSTKEPVNDEEIDVEIQKYLGQGCIEQNADPLEWWSVNAGTFKSLAQVAKKYLTAPSTSIESEQLFSTARDLYDYRRYNITPKNGEMLLFLNKAIPIIKKY
uniref:HAT C-terminal dimerisation domain-containing protein n=2 Tax=Meloidogyne enterolobii TaxID=390850 RepID=A0A6V7UPZ9_MELEN|nr:unnamed protein product [Meloidogyne enterolobii]CAD2184299.1 unnamed protein product [Meloidogyne enterolobii]